MYNGYFNSLKWRQCYIKFSFGLEVCDRCINFNNYGKDKNQVSTKYVHTKQFYYWVLSSWNNNLTFKSWHCIWPVQE